ncbi:MAG: DNA methyltransferase, partial [Methylophilaceae bacterium]|nr:DNA methyltransferase [Methylophilaceae bacterium]
LKAVGYEGRALEIYLVRLLFCLFAEDTSIFDKRRFQDYIENRTAADGSDLAHHIATLFHVLNTPQDKRLKNLDEDLAAFEYINGKLFEETLPPASFDSKMRDSLLDLCALDWSIISPAIFGSLFQSIMDDKARRNLGAHYTSEENILKLIKPLFLDALWAEFEKVKSNKNRQFEFHKKLRSLTFFDPACGCGNFLVITYRELRLLELEVLRASRASGQQVLDVQQLINVDVDQFYGIEIEEFPAQIAQVALWLTDHQMNMRVSEEFGQYFSRIPLKATPHIVNGNALRLDWAEVLPPERCSYVLGNPPFLGKKEQSIAQKSDMASVMGSVNGSGVLDFVSAWYIKAARYISQVRHSGLDPESSQNKTVDSSLRWNDGIRCAFVSTNSITQGEQVGILWGWMLAQGIKIHFAHRTFSWNNEARGKAAVHCVIIGFGLQDIADKVIYEYEDIKGEPHAVKARNINPYLVDAPSVLIEARTKPLGSAPIMIKGCEGTDDGYLSLTEDEKSELIAKEPLAERWIRPSIGGDEFLNNKKRWCLWLADIQPQELRLMPGVMSRVEKVKQFRLASTKAATVARAATPWLFGENRQPLNGNFIIVPKVSSERRIYAPIGFMESSTIVYNTVQFIPNVGLNIFGILHSIMHMSWLRAVGGRMKSDFQYSISIVYNNFPWPEPNPKQKAAIEDAAQGVLDARAVHPEASLADLYDPLTMPANLLKAHQMLDAAVDAAYGYKGAKTDAARVAFLFERYQQITSLLPTDKPKRK